VQLAIAAAFGASLLWPVEIPVGWIDAPGLASVAFGIASAVAAAVAFARYAPRMVRPSRPASS